MPHFSLDEAKAQKVVDEIKAAGGDAIAVGGDVGADDFPEKILKATISYVAIFEIKVGYSSGSHVFQEVRQSQPHREQR